MKKTLLVIVSLIALSLAALAEQKIVAAKVERVEQVFGYYFWAGGFTQKTMTVYYLVAMDGTAAQVGLSKYARTMKGDMVDLNWGVIE